MDQCNYDITIKQGANFNWTVAVVDEVAGVEVPTDLTGYTAEMQIRRTHNNTVIIDTYSTANGIITIDEANGILTFDVPAATTAGYDPDFEGVYDLELTDPSPTPDFVERIVQGKVFVNPEVTR